MDEIKMIKNKIKKILPVYDNRMAYGFNFAMCVSRHIANSDGKNYGQSVRCVADI